MCEVGETSINISDTAEHIDKSRNCTDVSSVLKSRGK